MQERKKKDKNESLLSVTLFSFNPLLPYFLILRGNSPFLLYFPAADIPHAPTRPVLPPLQATTEPLQSGTTPTPYNQNHQTTKNQSKPAPKSLQIPTYTTPIRTICTN